MSGRSLNLIDEFSLLKSENKSILFFVDNSFLFHNFSLTALVTHSKFHVDDKKLLMRKCCQLHFASSVNSLTLSHNCQEKFSSQWGLLKNCWNGARRLLTISSFHLFFDCTIIVTSHISMRFYFRNSVNLTTDLTYYSY